jgi:hypothetical protein
MIIFPTWEELCLNCPFDAALKAINSEKNKENDSVGAVNEKRNAMKGSFFAELIGGSKRNLL